MDSNLLHAQVETLRYMIVQNSQVDSGAGRTIQKTQSCMLELQLYV